MARNQRSRCAKYALERLPRGLGNNYLKLWRQRNGFHNQAFHIDQPSVQQLSYRGTRRSNQTLLAAYDKLFANTVS